MKRVFALVEYILCPEYDINGSLTYIYASETFPPPPDVITYICMANYSLLQRLWLCVHCYYATNTRNDLPSNVTCMRFCTNLIDRGEFRTFTFPQQDNSVHFLTSWNVFRGRYLENIKWARSLLYPMEIFENI